MTYPASPDDAGSPRVRPDSGRFWAGAVATAIVAALIALVAAGLLYLLVLSTPQPSVFFRWIIGLVTLIAVVYPFSSGAPLDQKVATAAVNLVLGVAIASRLTAPAARAIRRTGPRPSGPAGPARPVDPGVPADPYGQRGQGYGQQPPTRRQPYEEQPTRPTYTPGTP